MMVVVNVGRLDRHNRGRISLALLKLLGLLGNRVVLSIWCGFRTFVSSTEIDQLGVILLNVTGSCMHFPDVWWHRRCCRS